MGPPPVVSGDTFAVGSHTITCTATSTSGTDTKAFLIIVRSVPVITVPATSRCWRTQPDQATPPLSSR